MMRTRRSMPAVILIAGLSVAALAGCSGSSSSSEASPTQTAESPVTSPTPAETTASPTSSPTSGSLCTEEAIMAAIPEGSEMVKYNCANVAGTEWAAVEVQPGPTVFFLQANGDTWDVSTSDEVCGTASAGLPPELLDYCSDVDSGS